MQRKGDLYDRGGEQAIKEGGADGGFRSPMDIFEEGCREKEEIVKHGDIECVPNEGMPIYRRPHEKGRLIIEFKVNFPENGFLSPDKLSLLEKPLPERKKVEETDEMEQIILVDFDLNQERWRHYNGGASEDDEHHPGGGVQCQTFSWGQ
uniref:DnaJ heat shock protein family (Hsp40) member A1 n=1 Tax=Molossus molossus TaxID=27622 RepID=A0A7J8IZ94_MOLMO|nr:hypothetical protein HJG59_010286 [Molossus molossus]